MNALLRFSLRQMRQRPGRTVLTLFSLVIGVATIAAVEMTAVSTRGANGKLAEMVNGKASLVVTGAAQSPFDAALVEKIEAVSGVEAAVPIIQRPVVIFTGSVENNDNQRVRLFAMGVDPERDSRLRNHELIAGKFVASGDDTILEHGFAENLNIKLGDQVRMLGGGKGILGGGRYELNVVGFIKNTGQIRISNGGLLFITLEKAQEIFLRGKRQVDSIQIVTAKGTDVKEVENRIRELLPKGTSVAPPEGRTDVVEGTMQPTEVGLEVSTKFSIFLAVFIVFNTFLMNVGERRGQMAIMRAIGATRSQIAGMVLLESVVLGAIGTAIGLLVGRQMAITLANSLTSAMNVDLPVAELTPSIIWKATGFGLGIAVLASAYPAWRASRLTPHEALSPLGREDSTTFDRHPMILGTLLTAIGGGILALAIQDIMPVHYGVEAALIMMFGAVLLAHSALGYGSVLLALLLRPLFGVTASLAQRQVFRHRTRSTLTAGVMFIAAATGIGLSSVVLDSAEDVRDWYRKAIAGDFYVRAMLPDFATGESAELPEELGKEIRALPGIDAIDTARFLRSKLNGETCIVAIREFPGPGDMSFDLIEGDAARLYEQLHAGEVVVSSVIAATVNAKVGGELQLETPQGMRTVKVAAIHNEYMLGGLTIWMQRKRAEELLNATGVDGYILRAKPHQFAELHERLVELTKRYGVLLHSNKDIHKIADSIIAATESGLWGGVILGFIAAAFGVINTLAMNVLEQTRELGMLRIVAMTRTQVRRTVIAQAIILGLLGITPGTIVGFIVAYLMNIATPSSINRPVEFGFHPLLFAATFFGAMFLVLIAAFIPAYRASRINVLTALHYE